MAVQPPVREGHSERLDGPPRGGALNEDPQMKPLRIDSPATRQAAGGPCQMAFSVRPRAHFAGSVARAPYEFPG